MKTLILDGQIFQTDAWHRGMGKYMLQVMKKVSESKPDYDLVILFNDNIQTDDIRFETLKYLSPNFKQLHAQLPVVRKGNKPNEAAYIKQLDLFLEKNFEANQEISFMLTTLFLFDIYSEFPTLAKEKTMVFYDLIPLLNWKDLGGYFPPEIYMKRFDRIYEADKIFCISETTQNDIVRIFGIQKSKTVNVNGGFTDHHRDAEEPKHFLVPEIYILFPTGDLPHKNNKLIFAAFKEVVRKDKNVYLLITSKFNELTRDSLLKICSQNVIFTGNISDEELQYLYKNATSILFGSKYEGLGLPVLDAVFHGKPVVASRISVFTEMSTSAFYFFDVESKESAAAAMYDALRLEGFNEKKAQYPRVLAKYDWDKVAKSILKNIHFTPQPTVVVEKSISSKKIAIVSSNPGINPIKYGLGERLFFPLRAVGIKPDFYFDSEGKSHEAMVRPTFLDYVGARVFDIKRLTIHEYNHYDAVFYIADERGLSHKLGRTMAVLPGYNLLDTSIDKEGIIYGASTEFALDSKVLEIDGFTESAQEHAIEYIMGSIKGEMLSSDIGLMVKSNWPLLIKKLYIKRKLR